MVLAEAEAEMKMKMKTGYRDGDGDGGRDLNNGRWWLRARIGCSLGLFINRSSRRRNVHSLHFSSNLKMQDGTINKSVDGGACGASWGKCQCHKMLQTGHASKRCNSVSPPLTLQLSVRLLYSSGSFPLSFD